MSENHTIFQSTTTQSLYTEGQMWNFEHIMKIGPEFAGREIRDDYQKQNFKMKKNHAFILKKNPSNIMGTNLPEE